MGRREVEVVGKSEAGRLAVVRPPGGDFERLARELEAGLDALTAVVRERLREALPEWMTGTVFAEEEIVGFIHASLSSQVSGFRRGILPEHCSEVDAAGARAFAEVGELRLLLGGYRIAQMTLWDAWLEVVDRSVGDPAQRLRLLRHGSEYFFRYAGALSDQVADVYQRQLEQAVRSGEQRRYQAIRSLLQGEPLGATQLDLDLDQHHLGLITWGKDAEAAARELAVAVGRPLLAIGPLNRNWWCWVSGSRPLTPAQERDLRRFQPTARARLAIGLEAYGEAGFRATNRQAMRARWVARGDEERRVVHYGDVAVVALASENDDDARAFVAHELRGIDDDSTASRRIRETIVAYFAADHNAASAAAALGVHHQTVANRLRAAEERLGHPVGSRRVELETALRLRACLQPGPGARS